MLLQEWNWEDAKKVWQKEAEERGEERGVKIGEERAAQKWETVVADKDALIAELQAQLAKREFDDVNH